MTRHFIFTASLALLSAAIPLRAAERPHAETDTRNKVVWTNEQLEKLHDLDLICIVGQVEEEKPKPATEPQWYVKFQDPSWYAKQAAELRDELERRRAQLGRYSQAIEDARSLKTTTAGIDLDDGDIAITPQAGIEILQQRVSETQTQLDALEELARRNEIPPGTLRGR
jgi:hypothetical protein